MLNHGTVQSNWTKNIIHISIGSAGQKYYREFHFTLRNPSFFFFTDASLISWGASWQKRQIMGQWSPLEQQWHINDWNWKSSAWPFVIGGCTGFNKQSEYIATTAEQWPIFANGEMHYLSLFHKILELFQLLDKFTIILVPTHLPGARNLPAVAYYRNTPLSELCGLISWKSSSVFIHHYLCDMAADTDLQELPVVAAGTALLWRVVLHRLYTKAHHLLQ